MSKATSWATTWSPGFSVTDAFISRKDADTLWTKCDAVVLPVILSEYNMSLIMCFDRSVKEIHRTASGVPMAGLTTSRPCQTSHNRYICRANSTTQRWKFSLSYFKMRKCCLGPFISLTQMLYVSPPGNSHENLFWWWCHYTLIWLVFLCFAAGQFYYILSDTQFNRTGHFYKAMHGQVKLQ